LIEMVSLAPEKRQAEAETGLRNRLAAIDARIAEIDKRLSGEFPDFSSLASAAPSSLEDVQAHLRPDEALILFLDTYERFPAPEETFVWAVTKDAARWVRVGMGTLALAETVAALRCGLDAAAWSEPAGRCRSTMAGPIGSTKRCSAGSRMWSLASNCCSFPRAR
jgi:hypothetical protein